MSEPSARPSAAGRGRSDGAGKGGGRAGRGRIAGVRRPSTAAAREEENGSDNGEPSPGLARPTVARPSVASAAPKTTKTLLAAKTAAEKTAADSAAAAKPLTARPKSLVARRTSTASRPSPDLSMTEEADEAKAAAAAEPPPPPASSSRAPLLSPGTSGVGRSAASSSGALQVKALAGRLFPSEKEAKVDDLVIARLPKDPAAAAALVRNLQDALDDAVRARRRLTDGCAELEKELVLEAGDQRARDAGYGAQLSELAAQVATLKADKTNAVSAVEKRWRARRDEDEARHRTEVEEVRKKLEVKEEEAAQLLYVNMANERRLAELSTRAASSQAAATVDGSDARRRDEELEAARKEVSRLTSVLEAKSNEVSTAMVTFAEMQRMTVERESELKAKLAVAETKLEAAHEQLEAARAADAASRVQGAAARADAAALKDRLAEHRSSHTDPRHGGVGLGGGVSEVAELKARLAVETSLKERAEQRESAERTERVATNAQLVAVEQSRVRTMEEARVDWDRREKKLVNEVAEYRDRCLAVSLSMKEHKDASERLEAEKRILQRGLERVQAASSGLRSPPSGNGSDGTDDGEDSDGQSKGGGSSGAGGRGPPPAKVGLWGRLRGKGKADEMPASVRRVLEDESVVAPAMRQENSARRRRQQQQQQQSQAQGGQQPVAHDGEYSDSESAGGQASEAGRASGAPGSDASDAAQAEALTAAVARAKAEAKAEARAEVDAVRGDAATAAAEAASENSELAGLNERLKRRVVDLEAELKELRALVASTKQECADTLQELTEKVREGETKRRKLHNLVQELRGNVRVFARVRPFLPGDGAKGPNPKPWLEVQSNGESLDVLAAAPGSAKTDASHTFAYDKAFHPREGQDLVFEEVSEFVQSALDGYNVTLFSYGQTGSGKTHTMQGVGSGSMRGIIPRSIEQVAQYKATLEEQGWTYSMRVSFVEIYCEKIRDLLRLVHGKQTAAEPDHKIVRNDFGANEVTGVEMIDVDPSDGDAMGLIMEVAAAARATKKTDMNEVSSRSHSVFTLHLAASNARLNAAINGQLNLCDLAGSERVERSGATGQALTEAKNINKSLSALAHVFESLSQRAQHVPFRDSTLTYLLEPTLSGHGKTLMIINLSPTLASVPESVSTLRFGAKVNKIELGKAKRQIDKIGGAAEKAKEKKERSGK